LLWAAAVNSTPIKFAFQSLSPLWRCASSLLSAFVVDFCEELLVICSCWTPDL
jgi:hypothetical protein